MLFLIICCKQTPLTASLTDTTIETLAASLKEIAQQKAKGPSEKTEAEKKKEREFEKKKKERARRKRKEKKFEEITEELIEN